jgi:hypothetical protein
MTRLKAVLIGDSAVGKSCLYDRLESGTFLEDHTPTIGGAFATLRLSESEGAEYEVGLWDTAGQERYKTIIPMYFILAVFASPEPDKDTIRSMLLTIPLKMASAHSRCCGPPVLPPSQPAM